MIDVKVLGIKTRSGTHQGFYDGIFLDIGLPRNTRLFMVKWKQNSIIGTKDKKFGKMHL